jgi:hypothetical protein
MALSHLSSPVARHHAAVLISESRHQIEPVPARAALT